MSKHTTSDLAQLQSLDLADKVQLSINRIKQWYNLWDGDVYVSFSGGKDSLVMLDIVRSVYPGVVAVFCDTGLEYPEIVDFVKTIENVVTIKPEMTFGAVIEKYGYPVVSKKIAMGCDRYYNTKSEEQKELRLYGGTCKSSGKTQAVTISKKWHFLTKAPFKISDRCCDVMKKRPMKRFGKETGLQPFIGTMASDSSIRQQQWFAHGCNMIGKSPRSAPLSFWLEKDIWEYIKTKKVAYSKIYDMGEERTGCMWCMFGIVQESAKGPNRFQRMEQSHPRHHAACKKMGIDKVLDYIGVPFRSEQSLFGVNEIDPKNRH